MASRVQYEAYAPLQDGDLCERLSANDPVSLAAFRIHADTTYARSLSTLIESEIIPRLMVSHAAAAPAVAPAALRGIDADEVEAFAPLVMQVEADALLLHVESILARGVPFDTILVDLLAPTARLLGEFWEDDRCDFIDVTMGLWRLQEIVRELSARVPAIDSPDGQRRRALFAAMPDDQHGFGTLLVDEMFRHHGWDSEVAIGTTTPELLEQVGGRSFDIVGLTVTRDCHIARLPSIILALRTVSRNPRVRILVGGRIFGDNPSLAGEVGADGTASDARLAVIVAEGLVDALGRDAITCG